MSAAASASIDDLLPAWDDPVAGAQAAFRCVLAALAEPGAAQAMPAAVDGPAPMTPAMTALCLALLDHETPVWLDAAMATPAVRAFLRFHCGCAVVDAPSSAAFALIAGVPDAAALDRFCAGTPAYPDRSTTLLWQVPALNGGPARMLAGPGIRTRQPFSVAGLPDDFPAAWQDNAARFPLGADIVFCCGDRLLGLPRTTRLEDAHELTDDRTEQPSCT